MVGSSKPLRTSSWKPAAELAQFCPGPPGAAHRVGQLVRAEDHEGEDQDDDHLAPRQVEHAASLENRDPRRHSDPGAPGRGVSRRSSKTPRVPRWTRRSLAPTIREQSSAPRRRRSSSSPPVAASCDCAQASAIRQYRASSALSRSSLGLVRRHVVRRVGDQRFDVGGRTAERRINCADELHVARAQDLDDAVAPVGPDRSLQGIGQQRLPGVTLALGSERRGEVRRRQGRRRAVVGRCSTEPTSRRRRGRAGVGRRAAVAGGGARLVGRAGVLDRRRGRALLAGRALTAGAGRRGGCGHRERRHRRRADDGEPPGACRARSDCLDVIEFPPVGERAEARPNDVCCTRAVRRPSLDAVARWVAQSAVVQQRLPSLLDPPIGFAHRGARDRAPENTIEAFQMALDLGATGLESDVWLTADGVAVLDHDGVVRLGRRRRPIDDVPGRGSARARPDAAPAVRRVRLAVPALARPQAGGHRRRGHRRRRVRRQRPARPPLAVRQQRRRARLALRPATPPSASSSRPDCRGSAMVRSGPRRCSPRRASTPINLHYTDWSGGLVALFHRFERIAFGWDLQYDHVLRPAVRMGLDGVYSDHVDVMMEILAAEYVAPADLDHRTHAHLTANRQLSPAGRRLECLTLRRGRPGSTASASATSARRRRRRVRRCRPRRSGRRSPIASPANRRGCRPSRRRDRRARSSGRTRRRSSRA